MKKVLIFVIPTIVLTNYYIFYRYSEFVNTSDKDEVLANEFLDTPIFEELVSENPENENDVVIENNNFNRQKIDWSDKSNRNGPTCTSPEKIDWVFQSCSGISNIDDQETVSRSRASNNTCNLCSQTTDPFLKFLNKLKAKLERMKKSECEQLVLYTVAFGSTYSNHFRPLHPKLVDQFHRFHNRCLFTFQLDERKNKTYLKEDDIQIINSRDGFDQRILIPQDVLPYENNRRNTKIFKMVGHILFPWVRFLIWQDAKFRMTTKYPHYWPVNFYNYVSETVRKAKTCAVYLGLPIHESSLGDIDINFREEAYSRHCGVLTDSKRNQVSDSQKWIKQQCSYYEEYFNKKKLASTLSSYMIDSALMVRDMRSEKCRHFNGDLGCTWLDEIHCYSDRDQISFPYAMASMDIEEYDLNLNVERDHRVFVDRETLRTPMALILKSDCHYYFQATVRKCYSIPVFESTLPPPPTSKKALPVSSGAKEGKRIAIIVSGTLNRYFFQSSLQHLIKPLSDQGHHVDYYLALALGDIPVYGNDPGYINYISTDPVFKNGIVVYLGKAFVENTLLEHHLREQVKENGGRLKKIILRNRFKVEHNELLINRRNISKTILFPNEKDPDVAFPMKNFRSTAIKKKTSFANRNLLSMYLGIQELWTSVEKYEMDKDWNYDYVFYLRDDTHWLDNFDLNKLLTLGDADIYLLSCDAKDPPMLIDEINDHALVVKRKVANFFGMYFTNLFKDENLVDNCVASVKDEALFAKRFNNTETTSTTIEGCNSEMILKYMIGKNNFTVLKVPQSYLPFQRSMHLDLAKKKKGKKVCFHKYCQSKENKLDDKEVQKCEDIVI